MRETIEEAAENNYPDGDDWTIAQAVIRRLAFKKGAKWQQEQDKNKFSEEDLSEAYSQGWMTRERFDDLSPEIVYPKGLDYEEKQEYSFNLWLRKYKQRIV